MEELSCGDVVADQRLSGVELNNIFDPLRCFARLRGLPDRGEAIA